MDAAKALAAALELVRGQGIELRLEPKHALVPAGSPAAAARGFSVRFRSLGGGKRNGVVVHGVLSGA